MVSITSLGLSVVGIGVSRTLIFGMRLPLFLSFSVYGSGDEREDQKVTEESTIWLRNTVKEKLVTSRTMTGLNIPFRVF